MARGNGLRVLQVVCGLAVALALVVGTTQPAAAVGRFPDFTPPRTDNLAGCPRVAIEGFRGSGQAFDDGTLGLGSSVKSLYDALKVRLGPASVGSSAASYPAVPWAIGFNRLDLWLAFANNAFRGVFRNDYPDSVATGANDGASDITHLAVRCPNTKIVVAGFSQGAEVARRVLARLNPSAAARVAAVVLMGDSTFRAGEAGVVRVGGVANGRGVSWARYGPTITAIQPRYAGRVISDCHDNDLVCRGIPALSFNGHDYRADAAMLANFVAGRIDPPPPVQRDRYAVTSYDRMAAGAPHHGYFTSAWQGFVARSNRLTYLGVTVGNPRLPAGQPVAANVTIRLCPEPACRTVLAQVNPRIVNYGNSAQDIGDVPVTPGSVYYIVLYQPAAAAGSTWVTYWWAGGPRITLSDQLQAVVKGFNAA